MPSPGESRFSWEKLQGNIGRLEGTARYSGLLLAPAEGFALRPIHFGPSAKALRYLKVQGIQEVLKGPMYPRGTLRFKASKRYLKVQGT